MKKFIPIMLSLALLPLLVFTQTTGWSWVRTTASGGSGNAIARDKWGNIYTTGNFDQPNVVFANKILYCYGSTDVFLVKYDAQGNLLWARSAGENGADESTGIAVDSSGNVYITGTFTGQTMYFDSVTVKGVGSTCFFVAKYDSSGIIQWARSSAGGNLYSKGQCVAVDEAGYSYIAGTYIGAGFTIGTTKLPLVGNFVGIFMAKYDANGNVVWVQWADGPGVDQPYAIATDNAGSFYLTGTSTSGGISFSNFDIIQSPNIGYNFVFLFRFTTANGNIVWAKAQRGPGAGTGICVGPGGDIYLTGYLISDTMHIGNTTISGGPGNIFLARYSNSGTAKWATGSTGGGVTSGPVIASGSDDNLYMAGQYTSPSLQFGSNTLTRSGTNTNSDMMVASFDTSGNPLWALSAGGDSTDALFGIATGDSGQAFVTGTSGSPSFKAGNIDVNCTGEDIFIGKIGTPAPPVAGITDVPLAPELNIYPNPNNGSFNVRLSDQAGQIQVLDLTGQVIQTREPNGQLNLSFTIKNSGIYFIRTTNALQSVTQRVVIAL